MRRGITRTNCGTFQPGLSTCAAMSAGTRLFILPGYKFREIDLLLTNFHLPRWTLFMLVAALAGLDRIKAAYAHAVGSHYRFFSYGDACLIEGRAPPDHRGQEPHPAAAVPK